MTHAASGTRGSAACSYWPQVAFRSAAKFAATTADGQAARSTATCCTVMRAHTYKLNFRMTRDTVRHVSEKLAGAGYLVDNKARNASLRMTGLFKTGVCLYFLAGHGKGDRKAVADAAGIGATTVSLYLQQFCDGVMTQLKPVYMPSTPPSAIMLAAWREEFASRRGVPNVAMAVDGTHLPFRGSMPDYRNYKGWESILLVAFVTSFYTFVDGDVGAPGRAGDNTVLRQSWLMEQIRQDPEAWLGPDGCVAADGGASDGGDFLLNPIPAATELVDLWYNFCHSSTRFFVEETFGRFKNRFRFLLYQCDLSHKVFTKLVYTCVLRYAPSPPPLGRALIMHNLCTMRKDDAVAFEAATPPRDKHNAGRGQRKDIHLEKLENKHAKLVKSSPI
mmetsp:Transcript_23805/g.75377  ORF Transcript_23805/g.75377 Transcript_23805/m.75377 type:complete len:390 (-) Transcript_23805:237-1406(-)